jgi:hypothetical protein
MRRALLAAVALGLAAVPARATLFGRSKLVSRWTAAAVKIDGDDADWDDSAAFEDEGLSFLAKNDATSLYLLVTAHTREARDELSGESHQDLALWFVAADGKTRRWGARLPFSRRAPLTTALRDPAGLDPEPEQVRYQGTEISTAALPGDVVDRLAAVGRRPLWQWKIPLHLLEVSPEGAAAVDFVVAAPPGGAKRRAAPRPVVRPDSPAEGGEDAAQARGRGKHGDASSRPEDLVWDAASFSLSIRLARDPAAPR